MNAICIGFLVILVFIVMSDYAFASVGTDVSSIQRGIAYAWNSADGYYPVYYSIVDDNPWSWDRPQTKLWPCNDGETGCHIVRNGYHYVYVIKSDGFTYQYNLPGCNVYTHEMLHAWKYPEQMIAQFFTCGVEPKYKTLPLLGIS